MRIAEGIETHDEHTMPTEFDFIEECIVVQYNIRSFLRSCPVLSLPLVYHLRQ